MSVDARDLEFDPPFLEGRGWDGHPTLIELGSGTGIVAAQIARMFLGDGIIIATDLPDVCPLLERNLHAHTDSPDSSKSGCDNLFVRPLAWGNIKHAALIEQEFGLRRDASSMGDAPSSNTLTHVICSDLVYFPELFAPLLRTLIHLTSFPCTAAMNGVYPKLVISYKIRSLQKEAPFWAAFGLWFTFRPVLFRRGRLTRTLSPSVVVDGHSLREDVKAEPWMPFSDTDPDAPDRTFVFFAYRRPESLSWEIPQSDQDLINGVGARGTSFRKADDTFETLLFMVMEHTERRT